MARMNFTGKMLPKKMLFILHCGSDTNCYWMVLKAALTGKGLFSGLPLGALRAGFAVISAPLMLNF